MGYTLAFGMPGMMEWIVIGGLGLLIFGKRLPEVGRSLGKGIVEFKKGLKGIEDEVEQVDVQSPASSRSRPVLTHEDEKSSSFKYDPYTGKPVEESTGPTASST